MATSATEWEKRMHTALEGCPARAQALFWQLKRAYEDIRKKATESMEVDSVLPADLAREIAERLKVPAELCLSQLTSRSILCPLGDGFDLPHVRRAIDKRRKDTARQSRVRSRGVTSHHQGCDRGVTGGVTPPLVSSPPITPSSSLPPIHSLPAEEPETDPLTRRIREYLGRHTMLNYSDVAASRIRKMVDSGGWNGMVEAVDESIARGVSDPVSYAVKVMAGRQAQHRLKTEKAATVQKPTGTLLHGKL